MTRLRQFDAFNGGHFPGKFVRELHQDARTVSSVLFASDSAHMVEIDEDRQTLLDDFVRFLPLHLTNETDAAGVVFELRIIEALLGWESVISHFCYKGGGGI